VTPADVQTLVDAAPVPPGYSMRVEPRRKFKYRNLWFVGIAHDGEWLWHRNFYNVAAGIRMAQKAAWLTAGAGA
jgi:hypothetical protein